MGAFGELGELGREGDLSSVFGAPFCLSSSGSSLTRYTRRLPVFKPTNILSPVNHQLRPNSSEVQPTVCKYRLNFGLVPLPELNNGSSCKGGEHGDYVPASAVAAPGLRGGFIEAMQPFYEESGACEACFVPRRILYYLLLY